MMCQFGVEYGMVVRDYLSSEWDYPKVLSREAGEAGMGRMEWGAPEVRVEEMTKMRRVKMSSTLASSFFCATWFFLSGCLYVELQKKKPVILYIISLVHLMTTNSNVGGVSVI